jgi:hypothetical protein
MEEDRALLNSVEVPMTLRTKIESPYMFFENEDPTICS